MQGKHLKSILKRLRVPLIKVAEELCISRQALQERLKAENISTETLEAAARASGKSPAYFYEHNLAEEVEQMRVYHRQLEELLAQMKEKIEENE